MEKNENKITISTFFKGNKLLITIYVLTFIATNVVNFFAVIEIANGIGKIVDKIYQTGITELIIGFALLLGGKMLFSANSTLTYFLRYKIRMKIKQKMANKIFDYTSLTYASMPSGKFVERLKKDVENWFSSVDRILTNSSFFLYSLAFLVYMSFINIWIGVIIVIGIIFIFLLDKLRDKIEKKWFSKMLKASESNTSLITEMVKGEKDIKSLKLNESVKAELYNNTQKYEAISKSYGIRADFLRVSIEILSILITFAILIVSAILYKDAVITTSMLMYIVTNRDAFTGVSIQFYNIGNAITSMKVSQKRLNELLDKNIFKIEKFGDVKLENITGKIEFKNVTFSYKNTQSNEENDTKDTTNILNGISFCIEPNKTTAIVGRSGSGKTTIISMIPKILEADSGVVELDGIDIKTLCKDSIRDNIALINQFPYIFDNTIKGNLLLVKPDATDEELWRVLEQSSLKEFVSSLPNQLETKVGEGGIKLSGGQRQRLSIARALLKNSQIMIFDESTSSLDNFAQYDIQHSLENLSGKHTIIIVAHRLSTIKNADTILFIENGKLSDLGTFDELFNNNESFQSMFKIENI